MSNYRWYFTAAATREYLRIAGLRDDDGGPNWVRAEEELHSHSLNANVVQLQRNGCELWRTPRVRCGNREHAVRLEMVIQPAPRAEGTLPQLVQVRAKTTKTKAQRREKRNKPLEN